MRSKMQLCTVQMHSAIWENVTPSDLKFKIDVSIENTNDLKNVIVHGKHYKEIQVSFPGIFITMKAGVKIIMFSFWPRVT